MRRVFGYARVSSVEQTRGSSLGDQQASIAAYAKGIGRPVTRFFVESESGIHEKIEKREQIRELLSLVGRGDLVIVDKLDRWSRDPEFTYRSVRELLAAGASFFAVAESLDPSTSEGDTALGFRILFAREEHKRIKERMVGTRKKLRDAGFYPEGRPPLGYRRKLGKGERAFDKNTLVIHEEEAALVRRIFRLSAGGTSVQKIADLTGRWKFNVRQILTSRVYLGEVKGSDGTWRRGKVDPIIAVELFLRVAEGLRSRRLGGARPTGSPAETDDWILRDVATCGKCGARMTSSYAGAKERARKFYYRCRKGCTPYPPVRVVEALAEPLIVARLIDLRDELAREPPPESAPRLRVGDREKLERKRARYIESYTDGIIERDAMRRAVADVDAKLLALTPPASPAGSSPKVRAAVLRDVKLLANAWRKAKPAARRQIVRLLAVEMRLVADFAPVPVWRNVEELALSVE